MSIGGSGQGQRLAGLSTGSTDFVTRNAIWDDERQEAARELAERLAGLDFVRVVYSDPHGLARSKTLTTETFRCALRNGLDCSPGPFIFDTGHAVAVEFFSEGGGIGIDELTGAGDFILVPDPLTFRVLPYTSSRTGWVIGDEYLRSGQPHPLSSRAALHRLSASLKAANLGFVVGLEVEWYLTRLADQRDPGRIGGFGVQGKAPSVWPVDCGYQFNLDSLTDAVEPVIAPIADALLTLGLPLRTVEHESGPGQLEFTFSPMDGLAAADAMLLFRSTLKQMCARQGYHASFMTLPGLPGFDPSGWHLHQSVAQLPTGRNMFADRSALLSGFGESYLAGLLHHAAEMSLLCVPTVNGYRRANERFSLSPSHAVWAAENRGVFARVLGGFGDPVTHIENRVGEPNANPYLYLSAQLSSGMSGVEDGMSPGEATPDPRAAQARQLPRSLAEALDLFQKSEFARDVLGTALADCLWQLKRSELHRYEEWCAAHGHISGQAVSEWEHDEYFRIY